MQTSLANLFKDDIQRFRLDGILPFRAQLLIDPGSSAMFMPLS
jgi:hypothetical protein